MSYASRDVHPQDLLGEFFGINWTHHIWRMLGGTFWSKSATKFSKPILKTLLTICHRAIEFRILQRKVECFEWVKSTKELKVLYHQQKYRYIFRLIGVNSGKESFYYSNQQNCSQLSVLKVESFILFLWPFNTAVINSEFQWCI